MNVVAPERLDAATGSHTAGVAARRFAATNEACDIFFRSNAEPIAQACRAMAIRFQKGGRLLVAGDGVQRSDVSHTVVEFVHPVVVGKRALPAMPLAGVTGIAALRSLVTFGRSRDIVLLLHAGPAGELDVQLLSQSTERGMLTLLLTGPKNNHALPAADHHFAVESRDPCIVQETHEMLYHVLWELVHVFFDHRAVRDS